MPLYQIAKLVNGTVEGDDQCIITGPSKIEEAQKDTITFLANPKYQSYVSTTNASAILVDQSYNSTDNLNVTLVRVDNVYHALATILHIFYRPLADIKGVSIMADVAEDLRIRTDIAIDAFAIVKEGVTVGKGTIIHGQVYVGPNVVIGENCIIYPGVKIYNGCVLGDNVIVHANTVIGKDGFGFVHQKDGTYAKIPQSGGVIVEDDVEIGANCVIDRASIGHTVLKKGVKLDNLIQIAHNVSVGAHTAIAAQSGIAGSAQIGDQCIIGGQVGIVGHIQIADKTMIQAKSGVSSNVKNIGSKLYGYPAIDYQNYLRSYAYFKKLPEVISELRTVQNELSRLKEDK